MATKKKEETGAEIVKAEVLDDDATIELLLTTPGARVEIAGGEDPAMISAMIAGEILNSDDPLASTPTFSSDQIAGYPIEISTVRVMSGAIKDSQGFYFTCQAKTQAGTPFVLNTSARNICSALHALRKQGKLPAKMKIESQTTAGGYTVLRASHTPWEAGKRSKLDDQIDAAVRGGSAEPLF